MTCLGLLVFALAARPALASESCTAPPGTSGIDQYCEALPTPGGTSHHGGHGGGGAGGGSGGGGSSLPASTKKALAKQGAAGAGVLALTKQSDVQVPTSQSGSQTPTSTTHHSKAKHSSSTSQSSTQSSPASQSPVTTTPADIPSAPSSNPVSAVGRSVSDDGGLLIVLLVATGVLGLVAWFGRRRRSGPESA